MEPADTSYFSDPDRYVTLRRSADGEVTVEVSSSAMRLPADEIGRLIVEAADQMDSPGADAGSALAAQAEAIGDLSQAFAEGGWNAFDSAMRRRLGLEPVSAPMAADDEFDAALGRHLGQMRSGVGNAAVRTGPAPDPLVFRAVSPEGDLAVDARSDRRIAAVWIGPEARYRGVEGLGSALTELVAHSRSELEKAAAAQAREQVPEAFTAVMDGAPGHAEEAKRNGMNVIDQAVQMAESVKRKAGRA